MTTSVRRSQCSNVLTFKTILIGDSGVGKSALIQKYIKGDLMQSCHATVGVEFVSQTLKIRDRNVQLQIWDTSGQDVYRSVTSSFYRGASAVFLVYAINNRESFEHLHSWLEQFYEKGSREAFLFVVGTKSDIPNPQVSSEQAYQLMNSYQGAFYIQTSVKQDKNVKELFERAAQSVYKLYTVSPEYKQLVDGERLCTSNISSLKTSVLSLEQTRSSLLYEPKKRRCWG